MKDFKIKIFLAAVMSTLVISSVNAYALENQVSKINANDKLEQEVEEVEEKQDVTNTEQKDMKEEADNSQQDEITEQAEVKQGWVKEGSYYYYYVDGEPLKQEWLKQDGYSYYLDSTGRMLRDGRFNIPTDDEPSIDRFYRLDKNGRMITGWYYNEKEKGYEYYYEDGHGAYREGFGVIIDGEEYCFMPYMLSNESAVYENEIYYFGQDGRFKEKTKAKKDGWLNFKGQWFYSKNNQLLKCQWLDYGGYRYYFNDKGSMSFNEELYANNESGEMHIYRFDKDGHMITGWYLNENDKYYYYNELGERVDGFYEINGNTYCFNYYGMLTDKIEKDDNYIYYFGDDGKCSSKVKLSVGGWFPVKDKWMYVKDGELVYSQWIKYKGFWYYLSSQYTMYNNTEEDMYNSVTKESDYYAFDKNGHMVVGWHTFLNGKQKYYDANGKRVANQLINYKGNKYYLKEDGDLLVDDFIYVDGNLYKATKTGQCHLAANGWNDGLYYVENGKLVRGWKYINKNWYYFDETTGKMNYSSCHVIDNEWYCFDYKGKLRYGWINFRDSLNSDEYWYYAKPNGHLLNWEWFVDGKNKYYFYFSRMVTGLKYIDGQYYLFKDDGNLIGKVNRDGWVSNGTNYYYVENEKMIKDSFKTINGKVYYFDEDGIMVRNVAVRDYYFGNNGAAVCNMWICNGLREYKYYGEDGKAIKDSWKYIGGKWYYFKGTAMCILDCLIGNTIHHFTKDGEWLDNSQVASRGWHMINGYYYYFYDLGKYIKDGCYIEDRYRYFDHGRLICEGKIYGSYGRQYVGRDLKLCSGWCNRGRSYATGKHNCLVNGLSIINNKRYYFRDYDLVTHNILSEDGKTAYIIAPNGEVKDIINAKGTGWYLASSGKWYYQYDGAFATGKWLVKNKFYVMDDVSGEMITNKLLVGYGYVDSNGELKTTGWYKDEYLPMVSDGTECRAMDYNGYHYYFVDGLSYKGIIFIENKNYYYDGQGKRSVVNFKEGWNKFKGSWYYVDERAVVNSDTTAEDRLMRIGNEDYYFGFDGKMVTNKFITKYDFQEEHRYKLYIGSDGLVFNKGWKLIDGMYYYFNNNGRMMKGTHTIDSVEYVFDLEGRLI